MMICRDDRHCPLCSDDCETYIEVESVRYGRWIGTEYDGYADGFPVYDLQECSECGEKVRGEDVPDTHAYCYACGAKMEGD